MKDNIVYGFIILVVVLLVGMQLGEWRYKKHCERLSDLRDVQYLECKL